MYTNADLLADLDESYTSFKKKPRKLFDLVLKEYNHQIVPNAETDEDYYKIFKITSKELYEQLSITGENKEEQLFKVLKKAQQKITFQLTNNYLFPAFVIIDVRHINKNTHSVKFVLNEEMIGFLINAEMITKETLQDKISTKVGNGKLYTFEKA